MTMAGTMVRVDVMVGIDPGTKTGLVALAVKADDPSDATHWRWRGSHVLGPSTRAGATPTQNKLRSLFVNAREWIAEQRAAVVVIERPANNRPRGWDSAGQKKGRSESVETSYAMGEAFGMLACAAHSVGARVLDYPATSSKRRGDGWMPRVRSGPLVHVAKREQTLDHLRTQAQALLMRSRNVSSARSFQSAEARDAAATLDENVLMALGVLLYHLSRQPRTTEPVRR
jgi:hypothetical protein